MFAILLLWEGIAAAQESESAEFDVTPKMAEWVDVHFGTNAFGRYDVDLEELIYLGETLNHMKGVNATKTGFVSVTFDSQGTALDDGGEALRRADFDARYAIMGALDPELHDHILQAEKLERIPVVIWLKVYEAPIDREAVAADPLRGSVEAAQRANAQAEARDELAAAWGGYHQGFHRYGGRHTLRVRGAYSGGTQSAGLR